MPAEPFEDYYEYLQVSPNADVETIERIYRLLAKRYHPDNAETGSAEKFELLTTAFKTLSDPEKRAAYDVQYEKIRRREWQAAAATGAGGGSEGDRQIRRTLLSILYIQRRETPANPGVGTWQIEKLVGLPEKIVEFHIWYLKEKQWIARMDTGGYAITAAGVDEIEADGLVLGKDLLLAETTADLRDGPRPLIEEETPSDVAAHEKAVQSLAAKVALNPGNVAAWVGLVYFQNKLGREPEALDAARNLLLVKPDFSVAAFEKTLQLKFRVPPLDNDALLQRAGMK